MASGFKFYTSTNRLKFRSQIHEVRLPACLAPWRPSVKGIKAHDRHGPRMVFRAASQATVEGAVEMEVLKKLDYWLTDQAVRRPALEATTVAVGPSRRVEFVALCDVGEGGELLELPGDLGITSVDAQNHEVVGRIAEGRSQLVQLGLWLMAERQKGTASKWQPFLSSLPEATQSPVFWPAPLRMQLLKGSPTLPEAEIREAALRSEWQSLAASMAEDPTNFPPGRFSEEDFLNAMSVVFGYAAYLENAQCFALLPLATLVRRTGNENGCLLDYNLERGSVTLTTTRPYREGQKVLLYDGRPNGELFLACGEVEDGNLSDCLTLTQELVAADRLYSTKKQILESLGFATRQDFPIFEDRMPLPLLAYLRLARVSDPAQLAKVTFEEDVIITPANEYEVLQLLLGDCKERLSAYEGDMEADVKALQNPNLSERERLAHRLLLAEKRILQGTLDSVRRYGRVVHSFGCDNGHMPVEAAHLMCFTPSLASPPSSLPMHT
eukprot:jgi/Botrbrau1/2184/Bobra.101_2s0019.2